eukprot:9497823-Pyramimonas_sp.AAC.1
MAVMDDPPLPLPPAKRANSTEDCMYIHRRNQQGGETPTGMSVVWMGFEQPTEIGSRLCAGPHPI